MSDLLKATPRPWVQFLCREANTIEFLPAGRPGTTEVIVHRVDEPEADANAALIAMAVNLHDELVAALRGVLKEADRRTNAFDRARAVLFEVEMA
jgi:hypothetical protein